MTHHGTAAPENRCITICINEEAQIAVARREALLLAQHLKFSRVDAYYLATAVSELAANIVRHAGSSGSVVFRVLARDDGAVGVEVVACDTGPGILNVKQALEEGFSTDGGLGGGLPGVQRLMDDLEIHSILGRGTRIRACKWIATPRTARI